MVADEIAAYLAGAGLGLVAGTNLYSVPFPASAPDLSVAVIDDDAGPEPLGSFGPSLSAVDVERPELLLLVRGARDDGEAAKAKAYAVYKALRRLGPVTLSGVVYHHVAARPPHFVAFDANNRPIYSFVCDIWKAESP